MTSDATAPATKKDVRLLMEYLVRNETEIYQLKQTVGTLVTKEEMRMYVDASMHETRRYFDVIAENIHHDLLRGALHDKVQQHEDRIRVLERRTGVR